MHPKQLLDRYRIEPKKSLGQNFLHDEGLLGRIVAAADLSRGTAAPGETVELHLRWQVTAPPGPALLHLFVHLGDPTQSPLAQADGPVMGGEYPSRLWEAGEVFDETVTLALPDELAEDVVEDVPFDYTGGFQPALVGLADGLPFEAFLQKHSDE